MFVSPTYLPSFVNHLNKSAYDQMMYPLTDNKAAVDASRNGQEMIVSLSIIVCSLYLSTRSPYLSLSLSLSHTHTQLTRTPVLPIYFYVPSLSYNLPLFPTIFFCLRPLAFYSLSFLV